MIGIILAFPTMKNKILNPDKAKPRVIVGRKATGPDISGQPGCRSRKWKNRTTVALSNGNPVFYLVF